MPAAPAFYHRPQTIEDLVDTVVARALQAVGVEQDLMGGMEARMNTNPIPDAPTPPTSGWGRFRVVLEMIKIEHTLFALPFALMGALLAARGLPSGYQIFWILLAMVGARSAAMAFNRLVDRTFDAANPRTRNRALPAGLVSGRFVVGFTLAASLLLVVSAYALNPLAFFLSPVALAVVGFYSLTKRFTPWSHAFLEWHWRLRPWGPGSRLPVACRLPRFCSGRRRLLADRLRHYLCLTGCGL